MPSRSSAPICSSQCQNKTWRRQYACEVLKAYTSLYRSYRSSRSNPIPDLKFPLTFLYLKLPALPVVGFKEFDERFPSRFLSRTVAGSILTQPLQQILNLSVFSFLTCVSIRSFPSEDQGKLHNFQPLEKNNKLARGRALAACSDCLH